MVKASITTFDNEFDMTERDLDEIFIKESNEHDNCFIWDVADRSKAYNSFLLSKNNRSKIVCSVSFYRSSISNKYLPRPTFKRLLLDNSETPH